MNYKEYFGFHEFLYIMHT